MKKEEAKEQIKSEFRDWWKSNRESDGYDFYQYLQKNGGHLLEFKCAGDPYQRINGWVNTWKRDYP